MAATWDRSLAYLRGVAMGEEFRDKGVDGALAPVAGPLGRSPAGGRNWEGFSPDPYLTGQLFAESVKGIQSTGQMAVGKHYIGNEQEHFRQVPESIGFGLGNITYPGSSNIDDQTLHELYLWPFADAVRAGMVSVMCSYNRVNNSDACQNSYLINHILKGELGFQGYVLSDWQAQHSGVSSTLAGLDVSMPGDIVFDSSTSYNGANLTIAVLNRTVPQWRLDDMVVRILSSWYYVGGDETRKEINFNSWTPDTFGSVYAFAGPDYGYGQVNEHVDVRGEHSRVIRQIGAASTILLKNVNGTLPLTAKEKLTAVFGEDAGPNPWGPNGCADRGCYQGTNAMGMYGFVGRLSCMANLLNRLGLWNCQLPISRDTRYRHSRRGLGAVERLREHHPQWRSGPDPSSSQKSFTGRWCLPRIRRCRLWRRLPDARL